MSPTLILQRRSQAPAEQSPAFGPIAERFRRAGELDRAVQLCREGLGRFPHHVSARVTLGWALLDLGRYDEARTELEAVLRRAPDNLAAIRGLAELHDRVEHSLHLPVVAEAQWAPKDTAALTLETPPIVAAPVSFAAAEPPAAAYEADPDRPAVFTADFGASADAPAASIDLNLGGGASPALDLADPFEMDVALDLLEEPEAHLVSEADIQALIAQAEQLEAAAELAAAAEAAVAEDAPAPAAMADALDLELTLDGSQAADSLDSLCLDAAPCASAGEDAVEAVAALGVAEPTPAPRAAVARLERFLRKVQARRAGLVSKSVA